MGREGGERKAEIRERDRERERGSDKWKRDRE